MKILKDQHPTDNYSPENCSILQEGPVWFLTVPSEGKENRACTVPEGESILIPGTAGECDVGDPGISSDEDLLKCATEGNDYAVVKLEIDGKPVNDPLSYHQKSPFFNITYLMTTYLITHQGSTEH